MSVLLLAEMSGNELSIDQTGKAFTAALALGEVTVLCAGMNCHGAAEQAAKLSGVVRVLLADDAIYEHGLAEPLSDLVVSIASDFEHIVAPATSSAKNVLPRVAALLDAMIIPDVVRIIDATTFERPIYAGNALQTIRSSDAKKRTTGYDAAKEDTAAPIDTISAANDPRLSEWVEDIVQASDRPDLTAAKIVVSGGRGLGSKEKFAIIEALCRQIECRCWRLSCSGRCWLRAERLAGWTNRKSCCA